MKENRTDLNINNINDNESDLSENLDNNIDNSDIEHDEISNNTENEDTLEEFCCICKRTETKAGKMIEMPGKLKVCHSCMQRAFTTVESSGLDLSQMKDIKGLQFQFADLEHFNNMLNKPQVKKKKPKANKEEKVKPELELDIKKIPAPHIIKGSLDEYIVGQEHAKKVISVAVYNHYKRIAALEGNNEDNDDVTIEKSNVLMVGPTGSGKTYMVKTLSKLLNVPLAVADATSLTEAGYIGDDIESVLSKLLAAADNDVERAERGIVFIDEIDKIAKKKNSNTRDVSGESVQQELLKMLEGTSIEVPIGSNSKNAMVPMATIDTSQILFICGGAFPDLDEIIKERLNKQAAIGFSSDLKDKYDDKKEMWKNVTIEDFRKFGMIPEFLGRLPIIVTLEGLTVEFLVKILKEPKNAIIKQYRKLLALDEVELIFEDEALEVIANKAMKKDIGARALRAIIEEYMLDIMYEIPKDSNIGRVEITKEYLEQLGGPRIVMRGM